MDRKFAMKRNAVESVFIGEKWRDKIRTTTAQKRANPSNCRGIEKSGSLVTPRSSIKMSTTSEAQGASSLQDLKREIQKRQEALKETEQKIDKLETHVQLQ